MALVMRWTSYGISEHWNEYIGAKMRACPYPGGKARKRYLYAACAEYRFVFSQ